MLQLFQDSVGFSSIYRRLSSIRITISELQQAVNKGRAIIINTAIEGLNLCYLTAHLLGLISLKLG
jgi:hypothetical protein